MNYKCDGTLYMNTNMTSINRKTERKKRIKEKRRVSKSHYLLRHGLYHFNRVIMCTYIG